MLFLLLINILILVSGNEPNVELDTKEPVENVISEKETSADENIAESHDQEEVIIDEDEDDETRPVQINTLKVVQDNVSGNKHSSFSEDKSRNRGDESTVTDIKREAEKKLEEQGKLQADNNEVVSEEILTEPFEEKQEGENIKTKAEVESKQEFTKDPKPPDESLTADIHKDVEEPKNLKGEIAEKEELNEPIDAELLLPKTTIAPKIDESVRQESESDTTPEQDATKIVNDHSDKPSKETSAESNTPDKTKVLDQDQTIDTDNLPAKTKDQQIIPTTPTPESETANKEETTENIDSEVVEENKQATDNIQNIENVKKEDTVELKEGEKASENNKETVKKAEGIKMAVKGVVTAEDILYKDGVEFLSKEKKDLKRAYRIFATGAENNHTQAMEKVAYPYLFGDFGLERNITKAVNIFQHLADEGSPVGQQGLGFIYGAGLTVNSSQAKSLIYTTFSALGGDTMGQMMLGYRYFSGISVVQSCEAALTYYKKVAKKVSDEASPHGGNAVQRIRLYDELEQPGGTTGHIDEDLLQYYQFLADKGDLSAQIGLGQLYFQGGRGVDVNYEKAFKYFGLVGAEGNGNGLAYLGKMYMEGLHVKKDIRKAYENFKKAAEQKNPIAQAGLGMMYLNGIGVKKDYDAAIKYFSQAAEQGWVDGQLQLGQMYYNGIGVKKDYRQAVKYFTFASQSGHVLAFYNLATMHATGAGVMRSCHTATELFKNVAERGKWSMTFMDAHDAYKSGDIETALLKYYFLAELGYEIAQSNVAYILDKGDVDMFSVNQTFARALLQWSRAAHQGYSIARVKVGDYHYYGMGTKVDYETAALHYRLASDQQSNPQAMFNLGYMHEQGFGLKKDIHLAKRFYDMAAESSLDAQFPVYIALSKLAFYFAWEWILLNYRFWERIDIDRATATVYKTLGPEWDVYIITFLAGILVILLLFRRAIRR